MRSGGSNISALAAQWVVVKAGDVQGVVTADYTAQAVPTANPHPIVLRLFDDGSRGDPVIVRSVEELPPPARRSSPLLQNYRRRGR